MAELEDSSLSPPAALANGTMVGNYQILSLLGEGGFGIVYRAHQSNLDREVALKEFMPTQIAGRAATLQVTVRSRADVELFRMGMNSFINEARLLARFDHPGLIRVIDFFEANGTAYMVMPVLRGKTLKALRQEQGRAPEEAWLRSKLQALLGALQTLHDDKVYHRDVAPDNIVIEPDGRAVLLDLGAARRVIGDRTQALTKILKPAYAPIEQWADDAAARQGPWTDIYALGATLYYLLVGTVPTAATNRVLGDSPDFALAPRGIAGYSIAFLRTVDWMMAVHPDKRPQSIAELRTSLERGDLPPDAMASRAAGSSRAAAGFEAAAVNPDDEPTRIQPVAVKPAATATAAAQVAVPAGSAAPGRPAAKTAEKSHRPEPANLSHAASPEASPEAPPTASPNAPPKAPPKAPPRAPAAASHGLLWVGLAAVALVGAAGWWFSADNGAGQTTPQPVVANPAVAPSAQAASALPATAPVPAPTPLAAGTLVTPSAPPAEKPAVAASSPAADTAVAAPPPAPAAAPVLPVPDATPAQATAAPPRQPQAAVTQHKPAALPPAAKPPTAAQPRVDKPTATLSPAAPAVSFPRPVQADANPPPSSPSGQPTNAVSPAPAAAVAENPSKKCAGLGEISRLMCITDTCARSSYRDHPECKAWHAGKRLD